MKKQVSLCGPDENSNSSTAKYICITVGAFGGVGLLIWGISKIVGAIKNGIENSQESARNKEHMENAKNKRTIQDELWFKDAVASLKAAMEGCKEGDFNSSTVNYDCAKIESVLKELGNEYDWEYLVALFGKYNGHSLQDWLGCDGPIDRGSYNDILKKINVPEKALVTKQGSFFGLGTNLLIK